MAINLVVIVFVVAVVWLSIDTLAAGYFVTLMEKYHISPEPAHEMFVGAVHRYLVWACLSAIILSALLSYLMLRRVLAPLTRMTISTRQIASGNFGVRVPAAGTDEIGQLAQAFNRMAEDLEKLENLRRDLMIDVAHELRTPLTNIRGYLEALNDGVLPPSSQTFSLLQDETMRLVQLVEDVLQLARADAARGALKLEPIDLHAAVQSALRPFERTFAQKNVHVAIEAPGPLPVVSADRDKIARVLRNLTDNAARYTPRSESVSIRIHPSDQLQHIRVAYLNTADEMAGDDPNHLFERFFRGEKSRSRQHGGAGIGLSIVKELVQAHGGTVGARISGNRFEVWFELPVSAEHRSAEKRHDPKNRHLSKRHN
jgi:signal transduction histidine kinase